MKEKNKKLDAFLNALTGVSAKMARSKVMAAITETMSSTLSVVLIGSFALLIASLDLGPWQKIVNSVPNLVSTCYKICNCTLGLLSLYIVMILAYQYSRKIELKQRVVSAVVAIGVFLMITPFTENGDISVTWLGTQGMICAMLVGILVPLSIKKMIDAKLNIKLPESVPSIVADSFAILIPSAIIFAVAGLLNVLTSLTQYGDFQNMLFMLIQEPVSKVGLSPVGFTLIFVFANFAWWCGIHGNAVFSPMLVLLMAASAANQKALLAGDPLPNMIEYQFCQMLYPGGYGMALCICITCCLMKSSAIKSIGKASVVPAIFCIGEPILFGLPCMFNVMILIPMLITSVFNCAYWMILCSTGAVGYFTGVIMPWMTPTLIGAFITNTTPVKALIASLIMIVINCAIFYPFLKAADKKELEKEGMEA